MADTLVLDPGIRLFVVIPIVVITFMSMLARHYVMGLQPPKKIELVAIQESQALNRSRMIRSNGKYLPSQSFEMRRQFFVNTREPEAGFFERKKRTVPAANPMQDPAQMQTMMMGSMTNMVPMVVIGGIINSVFAGFVAIKVPFPLTLRFKQMLQQGIQLTSLSSSWVSSASFYFICVFGLRGVFGLLLGPNNNADQARAMQQQMSGAGMGAPADPTKAFKAESDALVVMKHTWEFTDVERQLFTALQQSKPRAKTE